MAGKAAEYQRELERKLVPMGWEPIGKAKNGHQVWRHPKAGTIQLSSTPSDERTVQNEVSRARWQVKRTDGLAEEFLMWLRGRFNIDRAGHGDFIGWGRLRNLIEEWDHERPGKRVNATSLVTMLKRDNPFLDMLYSEDADRKRAIGFRVYGRDYLLPTVETDGPEYVDAGVPFEEQHAEDLRAMEHEEQTDERGGWAPGEPVAFTPRTEPEEQTAGPTQVPAGMEPKELWTPTNGSVPDTNELVDRILKAATGVLYQEEHEKREMLRDELVRIKIGQGQLMHQIREILALALQMGEAIDEVLELDKIEEPVA